ncbi:MAG: radical SAM protein [Thermoplasmata archaeon]|nr:radical SAM protein [Thermoplasmata archaeon]
MPYITEFDPWRNESCTCPPKYSFNPYTGCAHACVYCYITGYIPNAFRVRMKKDVVRVTARECRKLSRDRYISMSNSSDPYPPVEREKCITRNLLKIFREQGFPVLIITKSDIVARDADILGTMNAVVSVTITTVNDEVAKILEPNAPPPSKRIKAIAKLSQKVPCVVRVDPLIPWINEEVEEVVEAVAPYVRQCVFSTLKLRRDALGRIARGFPELKEKLTTLYFREPIVSGSAYYLPEDMRARMLRRAREVCRTHGILFSSCRERLPRMSETVCDGSGWLKK